MSDKITFLSFLPYQINPVILCEHPCIHCNRELLIANLASFNGDKWKQI